MLGVILVQRKIGQEPDQWEDVRLNEDCQGRDLEYVAGVFRIMKEGGEHRAFLTDGSIHTFRAYEVKSFDLVIDGEVQPNV